MQQGSGLCDDDKVSRLFQAIQNVGTTINTRMDGLAATVDGLKGEVSKQLQRHEEDISSIQQGYVEMGNVVTKV